MSDTEVTVKGDFSGWLRSLATIGLLGGGMTWMHSDTTTRIDDGKDAQRLHWQQERRHVDSLNAARDSFQLLKVDSILQLLKSK